MDGYGLRLEPVWFQATDIVTRNWWQPGEGVIPPEFIWP